MIVRTLLLLAVLSNLLFSTEIKNWYYPKWAEEAKYNKPLSVKDTDSALGRLNIKKKEIDLHTLTLPMGISVTA